VADDFDGRLGDEHGESQPAAVDERVRQAKVRQFAWLKRSREATGADTAWRPQKRYRKAALRWLQHFDTQVRRA
jgi:hypothetical protein